ncbi:protein NipSnap homolog 3B-like [Palaemon carinicauda]|uniref:protein NipSnap homolog 3B-like n=1 Tax=Palaemon carinicauda TaxID=392227 RepID=UPI0035B68A33
MSKMFRVRHFSTSLTNPRSKWNLLSSTTKVRMSLPVTRLVHSSSDDASQKIHELRIYSINPNNVRDFLTLTSEEFHLRTSHSKLVGYWTSEIGGLNQVVHIWEYDSLSHRSQVRANLASDPNWNSRYLGRVIGMFREMTNSAMVLIPDAGITQPAGKGVYELQTLSLQGSPTIWSQSLVNYVKACKGIENGNSMLVGAWQSVLGPRQMTALLWQHPGPDSCVTLQKHLAGLDESNALAPHIRDGHNRLLLPHPVSPLQ